MMNSKSQFRSAAALYTDLATGEEMAIEFPGWFLGVTPDTSCAIFGQFCNPYAEFDRLRFWSLKTQDWLETARRSDSDFHDIVARSPDGRHLVLLTTTAQKVVSLNSEEQWQLKRPYVDEGGCAVCWRAFSLDAKFLIEHFDGETYLWSTKDFRLIGMDSMPRHHIVTPKGDCWIDWQGVARDGSGRDLGIRIDDPEAGPAWVTGARVYCIGGLDGNVVSSASPVPLMGHPVPGAFEEAVTFCCRRCGRRSPLPTEVIDAIDGIDRNARLGPASAPSLDLPNCDWDEPRLDFECPRCGHWHRSTPFYIDRRSFGIHSYK